MFFHPAGRETETPAQREKKQRLAGGGGDRAEGWCLVGTSRLRPQRLRRRLRRPRARSFERRTTSASTGGTRRSSPRGSGRRTTAPAIGTSTAPASRNISKTSISGRSYWSRKRPPVMRSLILILHQDKVPPLQNDSLGLTSWSISLYLTKTRRPLVD